MLLEVLLPLLALLHLCDSVGPRLAQLLAVLLFLHIYTHPVPGV